jgi:Tfp pilus assembly protein PilF
MKLLAAALGGLLLLVAGCAGTQKPKSEGRGAPGDASAPVSQSAKDIFDRAVAMSRKGDHRGAIGEFERAYAADNNFLYALYNVAVLYERLGETGAAQRVYLQALEADPEFEAASTNLTRLRIRAGRASEAEADLKSRIGRFPASPGLRNQLVELFIATGRLDAAEKEARAILKSDEQNVRAMVSLASVYHSKRRNELAKMVLENARQIDPDDPTVWNKLGFVEIALGDRPQALEHFKKAASLRPDYTEGHLNYGAMLNEAEDFAGAAKELELAVRSAPDNAAAHLNLGNAYRGLKEFAKSEREYERALQLDPKLDDVYFNLGTLYVDVESPDIKTLPRLERALAFFDKYAAVGGSDPKLASYRKDAQRLVDREKKRIAREEKEKLRKASEAKKKEEPAPKPPAAEKNTKTAAPAPRGAPPKTTPDKKKRVKKPKGAGGERSDR